MISRHKYLPLAVFSKHAISKRCLTRSVLKQKVD